MRYTTLGNSGLEVSRIALGTMTFGREADEDGAHEILDVFGDRGGTMIDTADAYGAGASEAIVGSWLAQRSRHDIVIATKVRFGQGRNRRGLGRKHIIESVDASLRRLRTEYIDLYQVHMWDAQVPIEETWSTLHGLVTAGKVRYLGVSNVAGWQLQRIVSLCSSEGWSRPISLQPLYNLLDRDAEWELVPAAAHNGLGIVAWSPLRGGWLTGKFSATAPRASRARVEPGAEAEREWTEEWSNYDHARTWAILDVLTAVAEKRRCTPGEVALNWLLQKDGVTAPIVGARSVTQLVPHLGVTDWSLEPDDVQALDAVSIVRKPYPYALLDDLVDA